MELKPNEYEYEQISDGWGYVNNGMCESWVCVGKAKGTAGTLTRYALCNRIVKDGKESVEYVRSLSEDEVDHIFFCK